MRMEQAALTQSKLMHRQANTPPLSCQQKFASGNLELKSHKTFGVFDIFYYRDLLKGVLDF